ncbi:PaaX domain-containing protein [Halorubrum sp. CGM4_25_10-8A]|uniref:PaaX domain-containing protein n=1 Tax=Halorubrum sp. CGM4_25_10-8A TaxID=2518116 RepID=UPI0010F7E0DE|nr:PaaX domain-containing protein [Halorubrum sp. CGM4_25_10-8A]TKX40038.1 PaaX domain-containing protein [Halorubrum sp. CGM4_25_10-8A]
MPIDLRTHDSSDDIHIDPSTNKAAIIQLLYTNPNYGFTPSEIHDRLDNIPKGSITGTLTRLFNDSDIGKTADGYYHALESRDDLRRFARGLVQVRNLTDRYDDVFSPADIEQTDERSPSGAQSEIRQDSSANDEPAPEDWIASTDDSEQA